MTSQAPTLTEYSTSDAILQGFGAKKLLHFFCTRKVRRAQAVSCARRGAVLTAAAAVMTVVAVVAMAAAAVVAGVAVVTVIAVIAVVAATVVAVIAAAGRARDAAVAAAMAAAAGRAGDVGAVAAAGAAHDACRGEADAAARTGAGKGDLRNAVAVGACHIERPPGRCRLGRAKIFRRYILCTGRKSCYNGSKRKTGGCLSHGTTHCTGKATGKAGIYRARVRAVSYTHLRAHET